MNAAPRVSVVIPTYNQPALLLETLASVFAQSFDDYEVIVINDGSTDDTLDRLGSLIEQHGDRLRVITHPNAGTGAAHNRGIKEARGKYVALLDHDDLWMPGKLATQVEYMEEHPQCAVTVVPFALSVDPERPAFDRAALADANGIVAVPLRRVADKHALLTTCSVIMFARDRGTGLRFGTQRGAIEDVQFYIGLLSRGSLGIAGDRVLAVYRFHPANASAQADYFYNGVKLLRRMDREGRFSELSPGDRLDMLRWLSFIGRAASVRQLQLGRRLRGVEVYIREFRHQCRQRRFDFILGYPLMAVTPRWAVHAWSHRRKECG